MLASTSLYIKDDWIYGPLASVSLLSARITEMYNTQFYVVMGHQTQDFMHARQALYTLCCIPSLKFFDFLGQYSKKTQTLEIITESKESIQND